MKFMSALLLGLAAAFVMAAMEWDADSQSAVAMRTFSLNAIRGGQGFLDKLPAYVGEGCNYCRRYPDTGAYVLCDATHDALMCLAPANLTCCWEYNEVCEGSGTIYLYRTNGVCGHEIGGIDCNDIYYVDAWECSCC